MEARMLAFLPEVGSFSSPEAAFQAFLDENPAFSDDLDDTEQDHDYNFEEILAQINAYSNERLNKWQHLLELTGKFVALRPWQTHMETEIYGIQDPTTKTMYYCSIMGNSGQHFALGVYKGEAALFDFIKMRSEYRHAGPDPYFFLLHQSQTAIKFRIAQRNSLLLI